MALGARAVGGERAILAGRRHLDQVATLLVDQAGRRGEDVRVEEVVVGEQQAAGPRMPEPQGGDP